MFKKPLHSRQEPSNFWLKVTILAVVVIWVALLLGNWLGHYLAQSQLVTGKSPGENAALQGEKPKVIRILQPRRGTEELAPFAPTPSPSELQTSPSPSASPTETTPSPQESETPAETPSPEEGEQGEEESPTPTPRQTKTPAPGETLEIPAGKPAAAPTPAATASPAAVPKAYTIQAGAFLNPDNAALLARELKDKGYTVSVSELNIQGIPHTRVQVGTFTDKAEAERIANSLKKQGYIAEVIPKE